MLAYPYPQRLLPLLACLAAPGCLSFGSGDVTDIEGREDLRECAGDLSQDEIDLNLQISADYAQSLHEMVACGGLAVRLCQGVSSGIIDALLTNSSDATPDGWTYQGEGVYRTGNAGTDMTTRFYVTEDYSFAAAGEVVTYDVFQLESYLVDPVVAVDLSTGRTELRFSAAGPLVELLGLGAEPHSPMQLSLGDTQALNDRLEELEFDSIVVVDDPQGDSTIQYHTQSPRMPAKALLAGVSMEFELVEATGKRDDTDQDLVVDEWTIEFADGKNLIGSSLYHVLGGSFGFSGEAAFDDSSYAQTSVSCN
ncbi:MAG: hypothetical protein H6712_13845 [Myxococcales bacterium]|nr:hypothetical protein [Myxococcales bacterium]MCB9714944.1 hypothetical protein [Myxococcales bacterium]